MHQCHAPCTMHGPAAPAKTAMHQYHARPSLPVNQNPNPTPPTQGVSGLHDTATVDKKGSNKGSSQEHVGSCAKQLRHQALGVSWEFFNPSCHDGMFNCFVILTYFKVARQTCTFLQATLVVASRQIGHSTPTSIPIPVVIFCWFATKRRSEGFFLGTI